MKPYEFICGVCGMEQPEPASLCRSCGGILELRLRAVPASLRREGERGIFRYADLLPLADGTRVSLGEGDTPLLPLEHLGRSIGLRELHVKCEHLNPTASFKDRAMAVSFSAALTHKQPLVVVASAGNASASAAAYGARSGIPVAALVPAGTAPAKLVQAAAYGAVIATMEGAYSDCYALVREAAETYGWYNVTTTYLNPYNVQGYKTAGYEIYEQLGHRVPDWIMVPVGAGPLLAGLSFAFSDLMAMGLTDQLPRLAGIQAEVCCPIAHSFASGEPVRPWQMTGKTIASGMDDELKGYAQDGQYTLDCIRKSNGYALALSEEELEESVLLLARQGVYAEPAGASGIVAARRLRQLGVIGEEESVVSIVSGNGLKKPPSSLQITPRSISSVQDLHKLSQSLYRQRT